MAGLAGVRGLQCSGAPHATAWYDILADLLSAWPREAVVGLFLGASLCLFSSALIRLTEVAELSPMSN